MSKVSVVVATYKREESLRLALSSLAEQTYSDLEIVLVDDNGNEEFNSKVKAIVDWFVEKYPNTDIQYIVNNPNQGSAKTRNIGIFASKGEYITFLDDDDVYLPEKVEKQVKFMEEGNYDYSITDLYLYDENGKLVDKRIRSFIKDTSKEALLVYHLKYHLTGTDTMMFKKEYLTKIGGFAPIDVGDEYYLMQRAIDANGSFGYLPCNEIKAIVHLGEEGGLSSGENKIKGENALYEYKQGFLDRVDRKTKRYIKMRHFAVLAFAEIRRKKYGSFIKYAFKSFFSAPIACLKMFLFER